MKRFSLLFALLLTSTVVLADEGMWLPSLIERGTINDMRRRGLRLSAQELYDVNKASLNDAIVRFGAGCTGEMISAEGLLLTNHHCGYGQIQAHSSLENDYLTNGFAAMNRAQELPNEGLVVSFLREMRDVTAQIASGANKDSLAANAVKGTCYMAKVEPMYNGLQHYLFVYEVFEDVRLVFAPPSAIGKFGGDTDNWMWPRHTGDFSMFRVYADSTGKPAKYSPRNVPYKPRKFFEISTKGIKEGDFTMVYGFPGKTQQYLHSEAVRYIVEQGNPEKIALRTIRLDVMNRAAKSNAELRIKYAAKNASVSNAWKKWQGELLGLRRLGTVERKVAEEAAFEKWAKGSVYEGVTLKLKAVYDTLNPLVFARDMYNEAALASEMLRFMATEVSKRDSAKFFKDYDPAIDAEITGKLFARLVELLPASKLPRGFSATSTPTPELAAEFNALLKNSQYTALNREVDSLYKIYIDGLRKMQPNRRFYPDANSTLRIAYGQVAGYEPEDGVYLRPISTIAGIMQKDNPEIYDYNVPQRFRELAPSFLTTPVAFLATNHSSGGNSGSPVLDANGRLIGLNFDRVWQGTMSDIEFDATVCRNISLDIRFVLFFVDKYAGAGYLLDEMVIRR